MKKKYITPDTRVEEFDTQCFADSLSLPNGGEGTPGEEAGAHEVPTGWEKWYEQ